jgi:hypothetical protein
MIGILTQDHCFDLFKGSVMKGIENQLPGWENGIFLPFLQEELFQIPEIGRLELIPQDLLPALLDDRVNRLHGDERYQMYFFPAITCRANMAAIRKGAFRGICDSSPLPGAVDYNHIKSPGCLRQGRSDGCVGNFPLILLMKFIFLT